LKYNKDILRKIFLMKRKKLSSYDIFIKSWMAQENILNSFFFSDVKVIGVYYPINNEVQTFRIINKSLSMKKKVCLPRLHEDKIVFFQINNLNNLSKGRYNIQEPAINQNNECNEMDAVVIPGIVFDKYGYRIGYGKGYYDDFLNRFSKKNIISIGLAYDFQLIPEPILNEKHDARLDFLVTDANILII
jgi:5-formyltetrahydrofolate cyclo-ligase